MSHRGSGKTWKSPGFFVSKRVGTLQLNAYILYDVFFILR